MLFCETKKYSFDFFVIYLWSKFIYYGLKGRSAKDCLVEFEKIKDDYEAKMKQPAE